MTEMSDNAPQDLDAKLAGLDDHLNPLEGQDANQHEEDKNDSSTEEKQDNDVQETDQDSQNDEPGDSDSSDDDGYSIDDGADEDDKQDDKKSDDGTKQVDKSQLTPEQQYILDNLTPIKVRGIVGDSDQVKEFEVLSPEQLPAGFKFLDDRDRSIAQNRFDALERKAETLQTDYRNQETTKTAQEFENREKTADRQDIGKLQRAGEIPMFKASPDSADFDNDPGVQLVQEVLDFKEARNAQYMEEYNAGRPYKHIGFEEAFQMFKRSNPDKVDVKQQEEDAARKNYAKRTGRTVGAETKEVNNKPRAHSGMTSRDLDALIDSKTQDW